MQHKTSLILLGIILIGFFLIPSSFACNADSECTAQSNGYCDVLKQCKYCSENQFYSWKLYSCASCDVDNPCTEQPNGYCNILGQCNYCSEGEYYYLPRAGCVECLSDSECTAQSNGYCDVLANCKYCPEGQFYSQKLYQCATCDSDNPCTAQPNGYCNILGQCNYPQPTPTCTDSNWGFTLTPTTCPTTGQQTKSWIKIGTCEGGVQKTTNEIINCDYSSPTCQYIYSEWSECTPNNIQTRTYTSQPENCQGTPVTSQTCVYSQPDDENDEEDENLPRDNGDNNEDDNNDNNNNNNNNGDDNNDNDDENSSLLCNGCPLNNTCYPINHRLGPSYCSVNKTWKVQQESGMTCENNFECESNLCISEECVSANLIQRILNWFKALFGL